MRKKWVIILWNFNRSKTRRYVHAGTFPTTHLRFIALLLKTPFFKTSFCFWALPSSLAPTQVNYIYIYISSLNPKPWKAAPSSLKSGTVQALGSVRLGLEACTCTISLCTCHFCFHRVAGSLNARPIEPQIQNLTNLDTRDPNNKTGPATGNSRPEVSPKQNTILRIIPRCKTPSDRELPNKTQSSE